jgi:hypothetical protein
LILLYFQLARHKVTENLHITERALLPTFLNRLAPMGVKIEQQRLEKSLVEQMTRVVPVAERVSRKPSLERHRALHVGRLVLNVSNYLIRLPRLAYCGSPLRQQFLDTSAVVDRSRLAVLTPEFDQPIVQ